MTGRDLFGATSIRRWLGCGLSLAFLLTTQGLPAQAAERDESRATPQPRIVNKRLGEEDQIRMRDEWFYSARRAGTRSDQEMWSLRLAAVEETRQAIERQRARKATTGSGGQNVWVAKGPAPSTFGGWAFGNVSGRIQALEADWENGVLYLGATAGGVWKSTNDGQSWTSIFESAGTMAVGAIAVDPNDSSVLWVGTGDNIVGCESYFGIGLMRSPNGGTNWELRNGTGNDTLEGLSSFASIMIDPRDSNRIVTGGKYRGCANGSQALGGLYTTEDGGQTWTERISNTEIHEILRDPEVPDILWTSTNRGIYKSEDNGVTWVPQVASGLPFGNLSRTEIAIAPSDPNTLYVLFDQPDDEFWRTTDGGATWSQVGPDACDGQCWYNMVLRVDSADPDIVYRGTIRIFKSVNGGSSWSPLTNWWGGSQQVHQDTHSLLVHPTDSGTFYVGTDGGVWKTVNGGASFTNLNGNLNVTQFYAIDVDANDPGRICGGAQDNSSLATDNDLVWDRQQVTGDGFVCQIDPQDSNYAYITSYPSGGYPSVYRSTNGLFGSFSDITGAGSGVISGDRSNWVTPYVLDPTSPATIYLGTHRAYRSDNHGSSWTQVGPDNLCNNTYSSLRAMEVNRGFPSVVFSGCDSGAVWRSVNGGTDWTDITAGLPTRSISDVGADPTDPDRAFVALGGFNSEHVWEWNASTGWIARDSGLPNVPANTVLMLSATDVLVGMDTGIFRSLDGGLTWLPYMAGLPEGLVVTDLKYSALQQKVTAGTYGMGAWQVDIGPPQAILVTDGVELPLGEVDGDGDGQMEPGETWSVRPQLRNAGGLTAAGVSARVASSTAGVTLLDPASGTFGDIDPGQVASMLTPVRFTLDPSFQCGDQVVLDLVDVASSTPPASHDDQLRFYTNLVQTQEGPNLVSDLLDEDFDPLPPPLWAHEVGPLTSICFGTTYVDEWKYASKDGAHGTSAHCGNGPGNTYQSNFAWLHPAGKDSENGDGFVIPADAIAATLTLVHWYDTTDETDGGQVAIDAVDDDEDEYVTLHPIGHYPGTLSAGTCNPLGGMGAFQGSSGGWVTSEFNLMPFKGGRVYLAFVFGSDEVADGGEGWYIDEVKVEYRQTGPPICDVSLWPGVVSSAQFLRLGADSIQASWTDSCNIVSFPEQTYSVQVGDLDALRTTGTYTHAPWDGRCDLGSPATFPTGPGNEYYLIVPVGEGREGGAGSDWSGQPRPQPAVVCGERREGTCP